MKYLLLSIWALWSVGTLSAQNFDVFWIGFTDKKQTTYSLMRPQEFLSPRALARRAKQGIGLDTRDLPVTPKYVQAIRDKGVDIHNCSKWLNGVVVVGDATTIEAFEGLDFVREVRAIGKSRPVQIPDLGAIPKRARRDDYPKDQAYYGDGENQVKMLNGHVLHEAGFEGQDMLIAVFDGGFRGYEKTPAFDSLTQNGRIWGTRDFVEGDEYVYESSTHGTNVLSTMASFMPYMFVGTAPRANYILCKTEDDKGEYVAEEYYWLAAAEYADSMGVDVINSSLGYYKYDEATMSYGYVDLDGNTAVITKAADWAAQRGMLVVTSAGNEGRGKWRHITVPADADSVLTVGAVDRDGYYARFSSQGFGGERVKPNVVARGKFAIIAMESVYDTRPTMGTSFSSPIMAGAATCLWQAFPKRNNMELIQALEQSASQAATPDSLLGYGVPDVYVAYQTLAEQSIAIPSDSLTLTVPNIVHDNLHLFLASEEATSGTWQLTNMLGQELATAPLTLKATPLNYLNLPSWEAFNAGYYFLTVELPNRTYRLRILKA